MEKHEIDSRLGTGRTSVVKRYYWQPRYTPGENQLAAIAISLLHATKANTPVRYLFSKRSAVKEYSDIFVKFKLGFAVSVDCIMLFGACAISSANNVQTLFVGLTPSFLSEGQLKMNYRFFASTCKQRAVISILLLHPAVAT